jgi:hypothetical protein
MKRTSLIIIAISLFMMTNLSHADCHYVSHTGSDEYPYTSWETAADSVQPALNAAEAGDTVYVGSGDYDEVLWMPRADSLIALIGMGMDSTYLHTDSAVYLFEPGHKSYISGIHFANYSDFPCISPTLHCDLTAENCLFTRGDGFLLAASSNVIINNCIFSTLGPNLAILEIYQNESLEISNCLFTNMIGEAFWGWTSHAVIKNNIVLSSSHTYAFDLHVTTGGYDFLANNIVQNDCCGGFFMSFTDTTSAVVNNAINGSYDPNVDAADISVTHLDGRIVNNSITNCHVVNGLGVTGDSVLSVHYSDFWGNTVRDFWVFDDGSIDTTYGLVHQNPMYENPDSGNFHLQMYSPLIDAGDPAILDVDGTRSDIGAFGGPLGDWTIYQDLPPRTPDSLGFDISGDSIVISWRMNTEADFYRYMINRDTVPGFTPWAGNIVSEPETSLFVDLNWDRFHNYYYRIAAYDNQLNLSPYSEELSVINVGIWGEPLNVPYTTYIESNYPNPFNEATTITFFVADVGPQSAEIEIDVYDILGRRITTLVKNRYLPGRYSISWNGRDENGDPLSSGVYFARISQWGIDFINKPRKIVILK